ncbi:MAG TPA: immunity protein Tsi6 family protein [Cellvibrio sp.]|nr:immunity protein Tsi6 family protein [Cellvibrio sp.]
MHYKTLCAAANKVILAIDTQAPRYASADVLASIKNQMVFIRDNALVGKNPSAELAVGTKFTYGILASRELASPDEILLKDLIDEVTRILISK